MRRSDRSQPARLLCLPSILRALLDRKKHGDRNGSDSEEIAKGRVLSSRFIHPCVITPNKSSPHAKILLYHKPLAVLSLLEYVLPSSSIGVVVVDINDGALKLMACCCVDGLQHMSAHGRILSRQLILISNRQFEHQNRIKKILHHWYRRDPPPSVSWTGWHGG